MTMFALRRLSIGFLALLIPAGVPAQSLPDNRPVLLGTSWCPHCAAARNWFAANKINYVNCDVETMPACRSQFITIARQSRNPGIPVFVYRGKIWRGFDADEMAEMITEPVGRHELTSGR